MGLSHALRRRNDDAFGWMQALGGNDELAQGDYFGCGPVGRGTSSRHAAGFGAEFPDLSLWRRYSLSSLFTPLTRAPMCRSTAEPSPLRSALRCRARATRAAA